MAFTGLTQSGSHNHHCPICHKSAKSSCLKKHLTKCPKCLEYYPGTMNPNGCPYCANKQGKQDARETKEKKKEEDKKDKKGKKDNGEGSSKGGKKDKKDKK